MSGPLLAVLAVTMALALSGCGASSSLSRYTHDSPQAALQAVPDAAGVRSEGRGVEDDAAEAAPEQAVRPARRSTAGQAGRSDDLSARPAGTARRAGPQAAPYTEEWWANEKREDARLRQKMNICRGC